MESIRTRKTQISARSFLFVCLFPLVASQAWAAAFVAAGEDGRSIETIMHPGAYPGTGGPLTITTCIDPASTHASEMVQPLRNVVSVWNGQGSTTGNLDTSGSVPVNYVDFESVLLHEMGHSLGLAHPNAADESQLPVGDQNYTRAQEGVNGVFDLNAGTDGVIGSSDDLRGDDVNLNWFRTSNNDPFSIAAVVDSTTYSLDLVDLPGAHSFSANPDRDVGAALGYPNTESAMQQGSFATEAQRSLAADDVAGLRYGMSGLDELEGTADDYTVQLSYVGQTASCDIVVQFDDTETDFAESFSSFISVPGDPDSTHFRIIGNNIYFNDGYNWYFTPPSFGPPSPLNTNAATDSGYDNSPQVATDGAGTWVAVWDSRDSLGGTIGIDSDILVARSSDAGVSWTDPVPLNFNAATDSGQDDLPQVATDGAGTWLAVWRSSDSLGDTIGSDYDILVARSFDAGVSWTAPVPLNTNAATDSGDDHYPEVATDRAGTWVAVWYSQDSLGDTIGTDRDILVARSFDAGVSWLAPIPLNSNAATDSGWDEFPQVTTDGAGTWVAVWHSSNSLGGTIGTDGDILVARSVFGGATWTAPVPLNTNAGTDSGLDYLAQVTTDGAGTWVAVWESRDSLGGTIGIDSDILVARSFDAGVSWTAPVPLNSNAATDLGSDEYPQVTTDRAGTWVAGWRSSDSLGGTIGTDRDILVARSVFGGATWAAPVPLNPNAATDSGFDDLPQVTTDGAGTWVAVWSSSDSLGGTIGTDRDILFSREGMHCGNGQLDPGEQCDDGNLSPGDCCSSSCQVETVGTVCRSSSGVCDVAETCDGVSPVCPADAVAAVSTECRASSGECDSAETCDGISKSCPGDAFVASGIACSEDGLPCTMD